MGKRAGIGLYLLFITAAAFTTAFQVKPDKAHPTEPKVNLVFHMEPISEEDYSRLNVRLFRNPDQANFMKVVLDFQVLYPSLSRHQQFRVPDLGNLFMGRYILMDSQQLSEAGQPRGTYRSEGVVYIHGLSEAYLRDYLNKYEVVVKWELRSGKQFRALRLGDWLKVD